MPKRAPAIFAAKSPQKKPCYNKASNREQPGAMHWRVGRFIRKRNKSKKTKDYLFFCQACIMAEVEDAINKICLLSPKLSLDISLADI